MAGVLLRTGAETSSHVLTSHSLQSSRQMEIRGRAARDINKYGQGVNSTVSDREGMEIRATKGLESYKQWQIKFRANCRTTLALSALLHRVWSRETVIEGDTK